MGKQKNTQIKEIAEALGVSPGTVSIVLNDRGDKMRISKATQKRIKNAAKEMGYQPNIYARRLRNAGGEQRARIVAVFWNSGYADEFMGSFFRGLQRISNEKGYVTEFCVCMFQYGQLSQCKELITATRYSGAIICGISDQDAEFLNHTEFNIPVVCAFRHENKYHSIYVDNYDVGVNVANLFAQRGHKRLGIIGDLQNGPNSMARKMGYLNQCQRLGLEVENEWIQDGDRDFISGFRAMETLLVLRKKPTAVFVNVPDQAIGVIRACEKAGLTWGKDIEVISVASVKAFEHFYPSISKVCIPVEELAMDALKLLMTVIQSEMEMPVFRTIDPIYYFGDTCGGFQNE